MQFLAVAKPLDIINEFEALNLQQIEQVALMDRRDFKFVFKLSICESVLKELLNLYKVLEFDGNRLRKYSTVYYDSEQLHLYLQHHNGKLNRFKLRHRTYIDSNSSFLEIKIRKNTGKISKKRIAVSEVPTMIDNTNSLFDNISLSGTTEQFLPTLIVNFKRLTLVNLTNGERITLDFDLEFKKNEIVHAFDNIVIAELKMESAKSSYFLKIMNLMNIQQRSMSKYCSGLAIIEPNIKKNNFKMGINHLYKLNKC